MGVLGLMPETYQATKAKACCAEQFRAHVGHRNDLLATTGKAWDHMVRQHSLIKMLLEENRNLTDTVFDWDNKVIQLQGELIGSQDKQLREMALTVERAVKESVEKSYSSVVIIY